MSAASNIRWGQRKFLAKRTRVVTMAGKSRVQGNIDQRSVRFRDALKRPADAQLLTILMQGRSGSATEQSAQVVNGYSNFLSEVSQRQTFSPLPAEDEFNVVDNVALLWPHHSWFYEFFRLVGGSHDPLKQTHNRLFNQQGVFHLTRSNLLEKLSLREISGRVSPATREAEGPFRMRVKGRIKVLYDILYDIDFHAEPIASVSLNADCVS